MRLVPNAIFFPILLDSPTAKTLFSRLSRATGFPAASTRFHNPFTPMAEEAKARLPR